MSDFDYAVPVQADAPWPTFRRDARNTGRSPLRAQYAGGHPWSFPTGKGIFSTPVIDGRGVVYVGSADHCFYALNPDGTERWRCRTGEIIDSAGALLAGGDVVFPSGDGRLRRLRAEDGALVWAFDARVAPRASYNNWWEGNVAVGPDGTLYAGNTNFNYYAVAPEGALKWVYPTGANAWSCAAFGAEGTLYWGSNDTLVRAVRPDGTEQWTRRTLGFIAASAAVGADGTVYIGSFDSYFYALDPASGRVRWRFKTGDHIYSSAAVGEDGALYVGSTDGSLYALRPEGGLLWRRDLGAPIRSSPALGRAPQGAGWIVYVGAGDGRLYALEAADGAVRWTWDTTPADPELRDRNDLNGSPALGWAGVYIGGEHGLDWNVPNDYPRHHATPRGLAGDRRDRPDGAAALVYVSPGGKVQAAPPALPAATVITLKLQAPAGGEGGPARLARSVFGRPRRALEVRAEPDFPFHWEVSADGRYLHVFPEGFLEPGRRYTLRAAGEVYTGGLALGNLTLGGRRAGRFAAELAFQVEPGEADRLPLAMGVDEVGALEWTRLAVPIPTMLPSLNQIGFDYMDWIVGVVALDPPDARGGGRVTAWAIGARRAAAGQLAADPATDFRLPLSGRYQGDAFQLANRRFHMAVTGIPIPFKRFELRGRLGADGRVRPGAAAFAETDLLAIPTFGPLLALAGLGTNVIEKLLTVGTYVTRPYAGPANRRPAGVSLAGVDFEPPAGPHAGRVSAQLRLAPGAAYPLAEHLPGLLLLDARTGEPVPLDYHAGLTARADAAGNVWTVTLALPADTRLPSALDAIVLLDVFPLARVSLAKGRPG
ncbi:MAG: PQQ-binding-like beta-propeller repeat protein [Anaerolineales bacterium]|nr:PQQ-binding-like beta-propeller repeat protein [Anaerolineales bacterium]